MTAKIKKTNNNQDPRPASDPKVYRIESEHARPAIDSMTVRLQAAARALGANPNDEYIAGILFRHIEGCVRVHLTDEVRRLKPWLTDQERLAILGRTYESAFERALREARAGELRAERIGEPVAYFVDIIEQVLAQELEAAGKQKGAKAPAPHNQFKEPSRRDDLTRALEALPEDARYLLHLRLRLNLQIADIAEILLQPQVVVQLRFETAVRDLQSMLGS